MLHIVTSTRAFGLQVCDCEKIHVMATAFIFDSQMKCFSFKVQKKDTTKSLFIKNRLDSLKTIGRDFR